MNTFFHLLGAVTLALALPLLASAQEATLRKNLTERVPGLTQVDDVRKTPIEGIYEVRIGNDVLYTDAAGDYLIQGALIDLRAHRNLTQERIDEITAIAFKDLPLKDAFPVVYGKGRRQMAVFEDPNCPYCKRFDKELTQLDDVTVHTFLIPILGPDSEKKSRQVWCSKDRTEAWTRWMIDGIEPEGAGDCDTSALDANLALARKHGITATPTAVFTSGRRVPGAIPADQVEKLLDDR